jgi:CheY-like chemotaxis protein
MAPESRTAPSAASEFDGIVAHCRGVVTLSRAVRAESHALHARYSHNASVFARFCRRLGRPVPRLRPPAGVGGGAGALEGTRVMLATDDADTRDLMSLLLHWCGASFTTTRYDDLRKFVELFRPDIVIIDLPFVRDGVFTLARVLRAERGANGRRPRLLALTKHHHDHPDGDALHAGFDAQIADPIEADALERSLLRLARHSR